MNSNELFLYLAPRCLIAMLLINFIVIVLYAVKHRNMPKNEILFNAKILIIGVDAFLTFILFMIVFFVPNSIVGSFLPTITKNKTITLPAEVIEVENIIKKENIIEIPSIILPIKPEGDEAVVIDTSSEELGAFMKEFSGQNAEFFNQRNNATYSSNYNGFSNYTGLDLDKIEYKQENVKCIVNVDKLAVDTVWLFTDLKNLKLEPMQCKVIIYAPRSITEQELKELKELGDVTVITIDRM